MGRPAAAAPFGNGLSRIDQAGAADLAHVIDIYHEAGFHLEVICKGGERREFASLSALAIAQVEKGQGAAAGGHGGGDAGVESTADEDDSEAQSKRMTSFWMGGL